ncbi:hypothetical protein A3A71_03485 [Candidatus Berkelbacteria bacterium RIFCSPLOWO2_01_FULL_50_28]|uniref:Response regulatory domain-containing protein n=1 Tax=Candidatus Berkelbacteria bacterium RIFCSPLOWO2_01_FULL_50_28 TaxID=1797471 RepID=A0A1F5ECH2_9BACT|nr:MAG: hypothetical protein A2807_03050 [Candidatus Berkelbacteria bacterium RIFCSPHIGHO2_01_FULL_50_36]OGD63641.1 MAG: hypothetical protein A3F39_04260 [Candidatus Berkelbacteria bacterium RIFCSPHIGHO2_12_FULL_50_11]OGD65117.1 MAG: hypothetical protein A3A71_03485 [Candidatus Berkelbacteria bacterium RIFCSPLOWO2_01_FULL_50_28]
MSKNKSVLLVEDESLIVELYKERFSEEKFDLIVAKSGPEALKKANGEIDLILLDVLLPGLNGFDVLRKLKKDPDTRDVPVIILTNLGSEHSDNDKRLALSLGAIDYLVKSYHTPDEMVEVIKQRLYPEG